jgi:hypothetical protein
MKSDYTRMGKRTSAGAVQDCEPAVVCVSLARLCVCLLLACVIPASAWRACWRNCPLFAPAGPPHSCFRSSNQCRSVVRQLTLVSCSSYRAVQKSATRYFVNNFFDGASWIFVQYWGCWYCESSLPSSCCAVSSCRNMLYANAQRRGLLLTHPAS